MNHREIVGKGRRVVAGWFRPTKKQVRWYVSREAQRVGLRTFVVGEAAEQEEKKKRYPSKVAMGDAMEEEFVGGINGIRERVNEHMVARALDAVGIFNDNPRQSISGKTLILLEDKGKIESALKTPPAKSMDLEKYIKNEIVEAGIKEGVKFRDSINPTPLELRKAFDYYAVDQIASELDQAYIRKFVKRRSPGEDGDAAISRVIKETLAVKAKNPIKFKVSSAVQKRRAWLFWKRVKYLERKIDKALMTR